MYHAASMMQTLSPLFNSDAFLVFPSFNLDSTAILESIHKYKCNMFLGLPKILTNVLNHPARGKYDLSSLKIVLCGGQHSTPELIGRVKNELNAYFFVDCYGMTEVGSIAYRAILLKFFSPKRLDSNGMGKLSPFIECKIVNPETGQTLPLNEEGELHVRGYSVSTGYWNDPEMTRKLIDSNRW
jgi:fatty-acyl-CoA synthase